MEKKKRATVNFRLPVEDRQEIQYICNELDCSVSEFLRVLVKNAIADAHNGIWID